ncbi:hypothetical protein MLD38_016217 [Melastoma candidum]|uniref:Uncharacterized protein n=1 Tax=Melastoma candidum TaxID=119954 RepID=A0ACB9RLT7_9MYRT|nr:hypothetical protein MLD38_016217 [Melastoma candidum]
MAGNEWINGYLEAILDSRASAIEDHQKVVESVRGGRGTGEGWGAGEGGGAGAGVGTGGISFNLTKYFVEEVVSGVDETDLHGTWLKVVATRNSRERSSRLENMCWRIWHHARNKKQLELDQSQKLLHWRLQREQGLRDATEEMSEDLTEGEKWDLDREALSSETSRKKFHRNTSNLEIRSDDKKKRSFTSSSSACMGWFDVKTWNLVATPTPMAKKVMNILFCMAFLHIPKLIFLVNKMAGDIRCGAFSSTG